MHVYIALLIHNAHMHNYECACNGSTLMDESFTLYKYVYAATYIKEIQKPYMVQSVTLDIKAPMPRRH